MLLGVALGAAAMLFPASAQARYCGRVDPASGRYFATNVYVAGASCSTTSRMLRQWLVIDGPQYDPPGYRCAVSSASHFKCRAPGRRLSFDVRRYYRPY